MSRQKAAEFLKFLESNKEFQEKITGFTEAELNEAAKEMFGELTDSDLSSVSGGKNCNPYPSPSWLMYYKERARRATQKN